MFILRVMFPKIQATVVALPKANIPAQDPKSYRPISLLCVPFKILERLIHSRVDPVVDPQLPREQADFRRGRSTVDQVTLLTQDIEDSFQHNEKTGVVFLDLTAAYDTVGHCGLHLKLLRTIPDRHIWWVSSWRCYYYKRCLFTINLINCIQFISLRVVSLKKMKTYKYST